MYVEAVTLGTWSFHGDQTTFDLIAASPNALNGATLARRRRAEGARALPLLGRKLHHKSVEELRVLGLAVDDPEGR